MARTQSDYLDWLKKEASICTDYQLARYLETTPSRISQLRRERLRLTLAECIVISRILGIDALEMLTELEFKRAKAHEFETLKNANFEALKKTIMNRMSRDSASAFYSYRKNRH